MISKNTLTRNNNKPLIGGQGTAVVLKTGQSKITSISFFHRLSFLISKVTFGVNIGNLVTCAPAKGNFLVSKFYELTTKQQKYRSGKAVKKKPKEIVYTGILAPITGLVKTIFVHIRFLLIGKRKFTYKDAKLLSTLVEKHKGNVSVAWQEFYETTGTNFKTFND